MPKRSEAKAQRLSHERRKGAVCIQKRSETKRPRHKMLQALRSIRKKSEAEGRATRRRRRRVHAKKKRDQKAEPQDDIVAGAELHPKKKRGPRPSHETPQALSASKKKRRDQKAEPRDATGAEVHPKTRRSRGQRPSHEVTKASSAFKKEARPKG